MALSLATSNRFNRVFIALAVVVAVLLVAVRLGTFAILWYSHHAR